MPDHDRLRSALRERQDEPRVKRMWDRIDAARARPGRRQAPPASSRGRRAVWAAAGVVAAAAVAALALFSPAATSEPAPLTLDGDTPLAGALSPGDAVRLSDGSRIEVEAEARVDVLESSARTVALALRRGRARFVVTPGGPRAWRVDCGGVTVEVVGTVFSVEREGARVSVAVERGSVLVRGDDVPDHVQRLEAGDEIEVGPPAIAAAVEEPAPEPAAEAPAAPEVPEIAATPRVRSDRRGEDEPAHDEDPVSTLLARADAARRSGELADAARVLEQVTTEHPDDPRAALAGYSLARLRLDRLGQPRAAARDFARALALGLPDELAEGARAGRAIALAQAGDARAAGALAEYLEAHPEGRYRAEVLRWQSEL